MTSWAQISYQRYSSFWTLFERGKLESLLKNRQTESSFKASPLNGYLQHFQLHSSNEADEAARDFAASIGSAYRISTSKTTVLERKYETVRPDHLLKHKQLKK
jgi:hypothetical protein